MSEVFLCPEGAVSKGTVRELRKAGVVVVESKDPERCQFIRSGEVVSGSDMLWAALKALQPLGDLQSESGGLQRKEFMRLLFGLHDAAKAKRDGTDQSDEAQDATR